MPFGGSRAAGTRVPAGADRICAAPTVLLERPAAIASLPGVSAACAEGMRIQYGGSANAKNAPELSAMADIDGFLVRSLATTPQP